MKKKEKEEPVIFNRVVFDTDKEYSQKELDKAIKEAVEDVVKDLNKWHEDNGYSNGTWVEARKYLDKEKKGKKVKEEFEYFEYKDGFVELTCKPRLKTEHEKSLLIKEKKGK